MLIAIRRYVARRDTTRRNKTTVSVSETMCCDKNTRDPRSYRKRFQHGIAWVSYIIASQIVGKSLLLLLLVLLLLLEYFVWMKEKQNKNARHSMRIFCLYTYKVLHKHTNKYPPQNARLIFFLFANLVFPCFHLANGLWIGDFSSTDFFLLVAIQFYSYHLILFCSLLLLSFSLLFKWMGSAHSHEQTKHINDWAEIANRAVCCAYT